MQQNLQGIKDNYKEHQSQAESKILYDQHPDYSRTPLKIPSEVYEEMLGRLKLLYGEEKAQLCMSELERILKVHYAHKSQEVVDGVYPQGSEAQLSEKTLS